MAKKESLNLANDHSHEITQGYSNYTSPGIYFEKNIKTGESRKMLKTVPYFRKENRTGRV